MQITSFYAHLIISPQTGGMLSLRASAISLSTLAETLPLAGFFATQSLQESRRIVSGR